jgi:hypothetical protein
MPSAGGKRKELLSFRQFQLIMNNHCTASPQIKKQFLSTQDDTISIPPSGNKNQMLMEKYGANKQERFS